MTPIVDQDQPASGIDESAKKGRELEKLVEDIKSAKRARITSLITAIASAMNVIVVVMVAMTAYFFVQKPTVDMSRITSDRNTKIELLKMWIGIDNSKELPDRDEFIALIKLYMAEVVSDDARAIIRAFEEKDKPTSISTYRKICGESALVVEQIRILNQRIAEVKVMMMAEEAVVPTPTGGVRAGKGPRWLVLAQTSKELKAQRDALNKTLPSECLIQATDSDDAN